MYNLFYWIALHHMSLHNDPASQQLAALTDAEKATLRSLLQNRYTDALLSEVLRELGHDVELTNDYFIWQLISTQELDRDNWFDVLQSRVALAMLPVPRLRRLPIPPASCQRCGSSMHKS